MKSGWQMEWECEMQYIAPIRSHAEAWRRAITTAAEVVRPVIVNMGVSMKRATAQLNALQKAITAVENQQRRIRYGRR